MTRRHADQQRFANLRAALAILRLPPTESELRLQHRTFDGWHGLGMIPVGVERLGHRLSLSHVAVGKWRAYFTEENPRLGPRGYGMASTPRTAVQQAAWAAVPKS